MNKQSLDTYLTLCTEYYELDKPTVPENELNFYLKYVSETKDPILEPMCGTGRFLIPLLEKGFHIEGFDTSLSMLNLLRRKCQDKKMNPRVWQDFLQDLDEKHKYGLIFIPCGSFGLTTDLEQAKLCLKKIYEALKEDGLFAFEAETLKAIPQNLNIWQGSIRYYRDDRSILLSTLAVPLKENIGTTICRYELIQDNRAINTEIEHFSIRLYDPNLLQNILNDIGFTTKIIKAYDHLKIPDTQDEVIVYECRKLQRF